MKKCVNKNCNFELEDKAVFCPECGTSQESELVKKNINIKKFKTESQPTDSGHSYSLNDTLPKIEKKSPAIDSRQPLPEPTESLLVLEVEKSSVMFEKKACSLHFKVTNKSNQNIKNLVITVASRAFEIKYIIDKYSGKKIKPEKTFELKDNFFPACGGRIAAEIEWSYKDDNYKYEASKTVFFSVNFENSNNVININGHNVGDISFINKIKNTTSVEWGILTPEFLEKELLHPVIQCNECSPAKVPVTMLISFNSQTYRYSIFSHKNITIGRKKDCDFNFNYPMNKKLEEKLINAFTSVSGKHCTIYHDGCDFILKDGYEQHASSNGIFINSTKICNGEEVELSLCDKITFPGKTATFSVINYEDAFILNCLHYIFPETKKHIINLLSKISLDNKSISLPKNVSFDLVSINNELAIEWISGDVFKIVCSHGGKIIKSKLRGKPKNGTQIIVSKGLIIKGKDWKIEFL